MFGGKRNSNAHERLDLLGRSAVRASASDESAAESAASSPFLFTRVRARILAERERRETGERWLNMFAVVRRAVPVMGLATVLAVGSLWFAAPNTSSTQNFSVDALVGQNDEEFERVAFADRGSLTNDEVLSAIMDDEQEGTR